MQSAGCKSIVFSSSATVYAETEILPIAEDAALATTSPYAATQADQRKHPARLRAGRPVVAHRAAALLQSGRRASERLDRRRPARHAEQPDAVRGAGRRRQARAARVFGGDYDTPDGTGVRDYLHVMDLAEGHVAALRHLLGGGGSITVNLGTGHAAYSVLELVSAFERASGRPVPNEIVARRARRHRRLLRRPVAGRAPARLEGDPRHRRDVRRQLALADGESGRLRGRPERTKNDRWSPRSQRPDSSWRGGV